MANSETNGDDALPNGPPKGWLRTTSDFVDLSFCWVDTEEGDLYWWIVCKNIEKISSPQ